MTVMSKNLLHPLCLATLAMLLLCAPARLRAGNAVAPDQEAAEDDVSNSLDEELLKELQDEPPIRKKPDAQAEPATGPDVSRPGDDSAARPQDRASDALDEELMRELVEEDDSSAGEADPLGRVARTMRKVEQRLARSNSGEETRELQAKIVADLDRMIEEALKQAKRSTSKSSSSSGEQQARRSKPDQAQQSDGQQQGEHQDQKPASDSTERLGADRALRPDPGEVRDMIKHLWGHLPEREREMMLNASMEQFLPKYEMLIEQYFRRLAEEQRSK